MTSPSIPNASTGKNNLFLLQTDPSSPTLIRIIRLVAYIIVHILTLGLLLLFYHCKQSCSSLDSQYNIIPVVPSKIYNKIPQEFLDAQLKILTPAKTPKKPITRTVYTIEELYPEGLLPLAPKTPKTLPTDLSRSITRMQELMVLPRQASPNSLETMALYNEKGAIPISSQKVTQSGHLNPLFVASYPESVLQNFPIDQLGENLITQNPEDDTPITSQLILNQLVYLNQHYYHISVPGDGNCFYRSCFISWMYSLLRQENPEVFEQEIQRILELPFAKSSIKNAAITKSMAALIQEVSQFTNVKELYDNILTSPFYTQVGITFLRNFALYTTDIQRITAYGGEENAKAVILSQIQDIPDMLQAIFNNVTRNTLSKPVLQHFYLGNNFPLTHSGDQVLLVLEFLTHFLMNDQEVGNLNTYLATAQQELNHLMDLVIAALVQDEIQDNEASEIIQQFSPEIAFYYDHFTQSVLIKRPDIQFPPSLLLTSFLLAHPACVKQNSACENFLSKASRAIRQIFQENTSLASVLDLQNKKAQALQNKLEICWSQKQAISSIEGALKMHRGFFAISVIPQLDITYRLIAKLLQNTPQICSLSTLQASIKRLHQHIKKETNTQRCLNKIKSSPLFKELPLSESLDPQNIAYSSAIQLFFLILQCPHLAQNPITAPHAKLITSIFHTHLQQILRSEANTDQTRRIGERIAGTFSWATPPHFENEQSAPLSQIMEEIMSFLLRDLTALSLFPDLRQQFIHVMEIDPSKTVQLLEKIQTAHTSLWVDFIRHLNIVGHKSTVYNLDRPFSESIPSAILLYSFICSHIEEIQERDPDLSVELVKYLQQTSETIKSRLTKEHHQKAWKKLLSKVLPRLSEYSLARESFLRNLMNPEVECRANLQSFMHDLHSMDIFSLMSWFNSANTQAEDEHVSIVSSMLGSLAVCQYLGDNSLSQTLDQLLPLAVTQGFLQMDHTPEEMASMFVLRANNHYSALLPKESENEEEE